MLVNFKNSWNVGRWQHVNFKSGFNHVTMLIYFHLLFFLLGEKWSFTRATNKSFKSDGFSAVYQWQLLAKVIERKWYIFWHQKDKIWKLSLQLFWKQVIQVGPIFWYGKMRELFPLQIVLVIYQIPSKLCFVENKYLINDPHCYFWPSAH